MQTILISILRKRKQISCQNLHIYLDFNDNHRKYLIVQIKKILIIFLTEQKKTMKLRIFKFNISI